MATPDSMTLLAIENWTALGKSVDFHTLTEKLNSSTSYTVTDSTSGLSLTVGGTGFTTENFFGYTVLATGTINSFTLSLHGKAIVLGNDYALPVPTFLSALEASVFEGTALPFFDVWFSVKNTVSGTAAIVEGNLANLLPVYVDIKAIEITSGAVSESVANFKIYENVLNTISGGFAISDSSSNVQAGLALLEADVAHINSIHFTNPSPAIAITLAQKTADAAVLAKITSPYVLDVHNPNGSWTTTGHGNNLTIADIKGVDTITGGGSGEDFVFGAKFGTATLTDFHSHLTVAHDTVTLPKSEFVSLTALLHDAKQVGTGTSASVIISAASPGSPLDHLTLQGMTLAQFTPSLIATDFKLV
jgi:hypothetical protein